MKKPKSHISIILFTLANLSITLIHALKTDTYNPQTTAMFPTSATLVSSEYTNHAIQFDAEFTVTDGKKVLEKIENSGKDLKLIIISCGDPDYYFGLQPIVEKYPDVKIVSSKKIVDHILATKDEKYATYAPKLGANAPTKLYVPEIDNRTIYFLNGQPIHRKSEDNYAAYYWIPLQKKILGGVGVSWNIYVFTADTQTKESRESWRNVLKEMIKLKPCKVIPGHYLGDPPSGDKAIKFTLKYLEDYEEVLEKNNYKNSAAVIADMRKKYPDLGLETNLELGAKVNTGEMAFSKR